MDRKLSTRNIFLLLTILILSFSLSVFASNNENENLDKKVPNNVAQVAHDNFEEVTKKLIKILEEEKNTALDISKFSLGEGYQISYIRNDILDCYNKLDHFNDFIEESDEWLYIINYDDKAISYLIIANIDGNYEVAMFGGNAEYFDITVKRYLEKNLDKNNMKIFSDANDYYLLNEKSEALKVPSDDLEYKTYRSILDEPMAGKVLKEIIKENVEKELERRQNNEEFIYGAPSLLEIYCNRYKQ